MIKKEKNSHLFKKDGGNKSSKTKKTTPLRKAASSVTEKKRKTVKKNNAKKISLIAPVANVVKRRRTARKDEEIKLKINKIISLPPAFLEINTPVKIQIERKHPRLFKKDEGKNPTLNYSKPSVLRIFLASKIGAVIALMTIIIPLSAFEAHVINVTATIERPPAQCDALSIGYWHNHEGCDGGNGSSIWETDVQRLSNNQLSGLFSATTGGEMCSNLRIPNCPSGNSSEAKLCRAKAQTLADELNVVSNRLDLNALLAGADDGNSAFDTFGLSADSTIRQALQAIESAIINNFHNTSILTDAAYVAQRIYAFYEDENPDKPFCVYDPNWEPPLLNNSASSAENSPDTQISPDSSNNNTLDTEAMPPSSDNSSVNENSDSLNNENTDSSGNENSNPSVIENGDSSDNQNGNSSNNYSNNENDNHSNENTNSQNTESSQIQEQLNADANQNSASSSTDSVINN